ncbi:MAG: thiamine diphosphokinase [Clostridia bacterium]|nr:thiamine diphosphokinase [Clostridia bacterium]
MRCYIFSSSQISSYEYLKEIDFSNSFVICADGGMSHANALGIDVDVWLGDGDSLDNESIRAREKISFPVKKDNTDTDLAVELALKRGFKDITIIGGIGGRLDHEFSHFCLLKKIVDSGASGQLVDEKNTVTIKNCDFELNPDGRKYVSFFPFGGDVENFSVKGLKYEAEGIKLESNKAQASSNSFVGDTTAKITFDSGYVLVISSDD